MAWRNTRAKRGIRAASRVLTWLAGAALLGMLLATVVDVIGRYAFGKPLAAGHAAVQALVFLLAFLGLPLLSSLQAYMRVELLDAALPPRPARLCRWLAEGVAAAGLILFGLQFLWQGEYFRRQGEHLEVLEIPLAWFGYLGGGLCLLAALLTLAARFPPSDGKDV